MSLAAGAALLLCAGSAPPLPLTAGRFTLDWQHSVEHVGWHELWQITSDGQLELLAAAVRGSGAGMEPDPAAVLEDGWWRWTLDPPRRLPELVLAASGATGGGWHLCDADAPDTCRDLGASAQAPVILRACR